ncbi:MAG: DUF4333 domain-containing protein [Actinomycetia bacterium]|nr:DUF4333 domain-containing protein [Actinomycetes bacterium]MCP4960972.1 DUF4333 domain-containing protein [Actinomycetes bacterium]
MKPWSRVLPLMVFLLVTSACGGSSKLEELEAQMSDVFMTQTDENFVLEDIECSEEAVVEVGASFQCAAGVSNGDGRLLVGVTIDGDGSARFDQQNAIVVLSQVEADVAADLTFGLGTTIAVTCGADAETLYKIEPIGGTFVCTATSVDSASTRDIEITVSGLQAPHAWRLLSL